MRFAVAAIFMLAFSPLPAAAEQLRPLSDALQQEQSPSMLIYASKRCAALYAASANRLAASGRSDIGDLVEQQKSATGMYLLLALRISSNAALNESEERITDDVAALGAAYSSMMQESYLSTGNAFSDALQKDFIACKGIVGE